VFRIGDSMGVPTYQAETQANDAREARAREYLQNVAERLRTQGVEVDIAVAKGEAVERIGARASETGADLIALATHGRTGLSRLVLGSVADKIVRGSKLPVLLVRPPSEEAGTS
jgi:nucleotide-binding universal stress UspA family protein